MRRPPETLWSDAIHRCVLRRMEDRCEVLLCERGRIVRLDAYENEEAARVTAQEWLLALIALPHH
jgi:hypothetical protein